MVLMWADVWPWLALIHCLLLAKVAYDLWKRNRSLMRQLQNAQEDVAYCESELRRLRASLTSEDDRASSNNELQKDLDLIERTLLLERSLYNSSMFRLQLQLNKTSQENVNLQEQIDKVIEENNALGHFCMTALWKCKKFLAAIQEVMTCPITRELIEDPCITVCYQNASNTASVGHLYNRSALEQWVLSNGKEPMTNTGAGKFLIVTSFGHKHLLEEYQKTCNDELWKRVNQFLFENCSQFDSAELQAFRLEMEA